MTSVSLTPSSSTGSSPLYLLNLSCWNLSVWNTKWGSVIHLGMQKHFTQFPWFLAVPEKGVGGERKNPNTCILMFVVLQTQNKTDISLSAILQDIISRTATLSCLLVYESKHTIQLLAEQ